MKSPHAPAAPAPRVPAPASHAQPQADRRPATTSQLLLQAAIAASPRQVAQRQQATMLPPRKNTTGLPDHLKAGVEALSGHSLDDVQVHYNSARPAQLQAHAYAQGTDIHLAPGQEKHLPHEAWHVVQQKQGRVRPTLQLKGVGVNDNEGLEREADLMARLALKNRPTAVAQRQPAAAGSEPVAQLTTTKKKNPKKRPADGMKKPKAKKTKAAIQAPITYHSDDDSDDGYSSDDDYELASEGTSAATLGLPVLASSVAPAAHMPQGNGSDEEVPDSAALVPPVSASQAVAGSAADEEEMPHGLDPLASPEVMVLHLPPTQQSLVSPVLTPALAPAQQPTSASSASQPAKVGGQDYSDIDEEEEDGKEAQGYHLKRVSKKPLDELARKMYEDESSESEADADYQPNRQRKAAMLTGIAAASLDLTPEQRAQRATILQARKAAFAARRDKRHTYAAPEQAQFMQVGEQLKAQSLYHNDYLRRATRDAVSEMQAQQGGSKAYGQRQGVVRDKLLARLQKDHEKMNWERKDFPDDATWDILQYLVRNKMSGASAKDTKTTPLSAAVKQGVDTSQAEKLNSATEFHHLAFKESMGGQFEHLALNPLNLVAVHGRRSEKKTPDADYGMHQFMHDITGFDASEEYEERAGLAKSKTGKKAGGVFSDIDTEALYYIMKSLATPRASKTLTHKPKPGLPASQ